MNRFSEYKKNIIRTVLAAAASLAFLAFGSLCVYAQQDVAEDITSRCRLRASSQNTECKFLYDNIDMKSFRTVGSGEQSISVDLRGNAAQGVYIKWGKGVGPWILETTAADGTVTATPQGLLGLYQEYVALPEDTVSFRIITEDSSVNPLRMVELDVFSPGTLPERVHIWDPTPTTAELMLVSTHQDDEVLFFGGTIPYYAGELDYDTIVLYTAYQNDLRIHEALECQWECGNTQNPIFLGYPDKFCRSIENARGYWNQKTVIRDLVKAIAVHQPQVLLTQDIDGEYGHGQHLLTVHCVRQALEMARDAEYMEANLPGLEPWKVSKCYLHLYGENQIRIMWENIVLPGAGGRTSYEVASSAMKQHKSQLGYGYTLETTGEVYDCRSFGLYHTEVGPDVEKNDFFENIQLRSSNMKPERAVPDYLEKIGSTGWLYRCTAEDWTGSEYMKYCSVSGIPGWYAADRTGTLLEPVEPLLLALDSALDITSYQTLEPLGDNVYRYNDGSAEAGLTVRFCAVEAEEPAFYLCESDGTLVEPLMSVNVSREKTAMTLPSAPPQQPEQPEKSGGTHIVIVVMCMLLVAVALMLSIAVLRLSSSRGSAPRKHR